MTVTFPEMDFAVSRTVTVENESGLRDALASFAAVRLAGTGSAQMRLPAPDAEVTVVSLAGMQRILRLEADDLTCSVEPGVRREDLDRELAERGVWLPCASPDTDAGTGTIGGLFAADEIGPMGPAQPEPRSLLLGMTGMLAEGKRFRSGAKVVKNVAGFDLQKLFVGSRGRLFATTELHLKLRPRPRGMLHFCNPDLATDEALALAARLAGHATRPAALVVRGGASRNVSVSGTLIGNPGHLDRLVREFGLLPTPDTPHAGCVDTPHHTEEVVRGQARCRRIAELLATLPASAAWCFAGERFEIRLPRDHTDAWLARLSAYGAAGEIAMGDVDRRGARTAGDTTSERLAAELKAALDPRGVLR